MLRTVERKRSNRLNGWQIFQRFFNSTVFKRRFDANVPVSVRDGANLGTQIASPPELEHRAHQLSFLQDFHHAVHIHDFGYRRPVGRQFIDAAPTYVGNAIISLTNTINGNNRHGGLRLLMKHLNETATVS